MAQRTSINLDSEIYKNGVKRAKALKYKSFSQYVEHLVREDVEKRPAHVTVREEPGQYSKREKRPA